MLCWNSALWVYVASHVTSLNQSERFISAQLPTLKFLYHIGSWIKHRNFAIIKNMEIMKNVLWYFSHENPI